MTCKSRNCLVISLFMPLGTLCTPPGADEVRCGDLECLQRTTSAVKVCDVMLYGAVPDGYTPSTRYIKKAIEDCAKTANREEPSIVSLPPWGIPGSVDVYLTAPFNLSAFVKIRIEKGVQLRGSSNLLDYDVVAALPSYGINQENHSVSARLQPLIGGWQVSGAEVEGPGVIDGDGISWWNRQADGAGSAAKGWLGRPSLIELVDCKDVKVHKLNILNPARWGVHLYATVGATISDVTVNATSTAPETAAVILDSSKDVLVERVVADVSDSGVSIGVKSGLNFLGRKFGRPAAGIVVRGAYLVQPFLIGPEICGGAANVTLRDSVLGLPSPPQPFLRTFIGNARNTSRVSAGIDIINQRGCGNVPALLLIPGH